jgi:predicted anti-sigma-YlaC factor YlaD
MTCEQTRVLGDRDPFGCTAAEVGAVAAHVRGCAACRKWFENRAREAWTRLSPEERRQVHRDARDLRDRVRADEEANL